MSNFKKDLKLGNHAENIVKNKLSLIFDDFRFNKDESHDISAKYLNKEYTFECKYDIMSEKTGNIAIEYFNTKKKQLSGIYATKADFWVIILPGDEIYVSKTDIVKNYLNNNKPYKVIESGGDKNSAMLLYKKEDILKNFIRIDTLDKKELEILFNVWII